MTQYMIVLRQLFTSRSTVIDTAQKHRRHNLRPIRHTSGISGGFRQLRIYVSAVMADFETFVMRPKEDTARDKLIPRKLVRQSRGDTKEEDVICYHSAHCRQILSIKTPLSSPSNSRII